MAKIIECRWRVFVFLLKLTDAIGLLVHHEGKSIVLHQLWGKPQRIHPEIIKDSGSLITHHKMIICRCFDGTIGHNEFLILVCEVGLKQVIDVNTGQIHLARDSTLLRSLAIGSCVVVAAYDSGNRIGAMAHIMLPGKAPQNTLKKTKYAQDAIEEMMDRMAKAGSQMSDIDVCLVGAGNVLKKEDDTICTANIESTAQLLKELNIAIRATALGGTARKSVFLDIENGAVSCTIGDGHEQALWAATKF